MDYSRLQQIAGYSLFELVVVIVIVGIIASISVSSLTNSVDVARTEETRAELNQLAAAICGDPQKLSGGARTDFGYVGDVGALPPNLSALVANPGGYSTWDGPYVRDDFYASAGGSESEYAFDAWGAAYNYFGNSISSTGGGTTITREFTNSTSDLLHNSVSAVVTDLDNSPPGPTYKDSVKFVLTYPDGSGGMTSSSKFPGADGFAEFDSIPIGLHTLRTIYIPDNDTLTRRLCVCPETNVFADINLFSDVW